MTPACILVLGPMYAEKTTELFRLVNRKEISGQRCIIVKYKADIRYGNDDFLYTHDKNKKVAVPCSGELLTSGIDFDQYDVIAIDEGQFMKDLGDFVRKYKNKYIIISGLNGDFQQNPWEPISQVFPFATEIKLLNSVCFSCKNDNGTFNKKIAGDMNQTEEIGGSEKYISECPNCYYK